MGYRLGFFLLYSFGKILVKDCQADNLSLR